MKNKWFFPLLLLTTVVSAGCHYFTTNESIKFTFACLSLVMWAALLGKATESVAHYAGERLGGLLNATFGNAAELIIAIFLVKAGHFSMVKASLTGSIIGNLLLVLGLSLFFGGLKYKTQHFNPVLAGHNTSLMMLAVIALFVPALFLSDLTISETHSLSLIIAGLLMFAYILWLYFSLFTHKKELGDDNLFINSQSVEKAITKKAQYSDEEEPAWTRNISIFVLISSTVFVAIQSEWLVHSVEDVAKSLGWSEVFVGAFLIAIIGNAAEHSAAIFLAMKNRMGAAVEIAIGSSLQIALFVAPSLVFISLLFGEQMDLVFTAHEIAAIAVAAFIASSISTDGSTNWYEGVLLIIVYVILGTAFFVL